MYTKSSCHDSAILSCHLQTTFVYLHKQSELGGKLAENWAMGPYGL